MFAREMGLSTSAAAHLLYGDHRAGRKVADRLEAKLHVKLGALWDQPCPAGWRPHDNARQRRNARRARASSTSAPADPERELAPTGS
jgi:hypothetical protein